MVLSLRCTTLVVSLLALLLHCYCATVELTTFDQTTHSGTLNGGSSDTLVITVPGNATGWEFGILTIVVTTGASNQFIRGRLWSDTESTTAYYPPNGSSYEDKLRLSNENISPSAIENVSGLWNVRLDACGGCSGGASVVNYMMVVTIESFSDRVLTPGATLQGWVPYDGWTYYAIDNFDPGLSMWNRCSGDPFWVEKLPTYFSVSVVGIEAGYGSGSGAPAFKLFLRQGALPEYGKYDVRLPGETSYADNVTINSQSFIQQSPYGRWYLGVYGCDRCTGTDWLSANLTLSLSLLPLNSLGLNVGSGFATARGAVISQQFTYFFLDAEKGKSLVKASVVTGSTGKVAVYVRRGKLPTRSEYDKSSGYGTDEQTTLTVADGAQSMLGRVWIGVEGCYKCGGIPPEQPVSFVLTVVIT